MSPPAVKSVDIQSAVNAVIKSPDFLQALSRAVTDALKLQINELIQPIIQPLQDTIAVLEQKVADLDQFVHSEFDVHEQYSRRNNLRLFGIPELQGEQTDELVRSIVEQKLGINLPGNAICRSHRVGKPSSEKDIGPRPIIVKFLTYNIRRQVFTSKKKLKGTGITLREDLTRERQDVCRQAVNKFGTRNVWTTDGRINIKDNKHIHIITKKSELRNLTTATPETGIRNENKATRDSTENTEPIHSDQSNPEKRKESQPNQINLRSRATNQSR